MNVKSIKFIQDLKQFQGNRKLLNLWRNLWREIKEILDHIHDQKRNSCTNQEMFSAKSYFFGLLTEARCKFNFYYQKRKLIIKVDESFIINKIIPEYYLEKLINEKYYIANWKMNIDISYTKGTRAFNFRRLKKISKYIRIRIKIIC